MNITLRWGQRIRLLNGAADNLIYTLDIDVLPRRAGIYVFGRQRGRSIVPVYVGQATRIRGRVKKQLNNAKLMMALLNTPGRKKYLIYAEVIRKPGQNISQVLNIVEKALIEHALAEGHDIVNVQGTKRPRHRVTSTGSRSGRAWLPKRLTPAKR